MGRWPQVGWSGRKEAGSFPSLGLLEEGEGKMHVEQVAQPWWALAISLKQKTALQEG